MWRQEAKESPFWLLLVIIKHFLLVTQIYRLAHAKDEGWMCRWLLPSFHNWCVHHYLLRSSFLFKKLLLTLTEELLELVLGLTGLNAGRVYSSLTASEWVEIDLRFSRLFQWSSNWIILLRGTRYSNMQSLLYKVSASFSVLSPVEQCRGFLAKGMVHVAFSGWNKWVMVRALRALIKTGSHFWLWILPNLSESVWFNPEKALLIIVQFALLH